MSAKDRNDSDDKLFQRYTNGVRPLDQNRTEPYKKTRKPIANQKQLDEREVMDSLLSDNFEPEIDIESGEELFFTRPGLQRRVLRKLKRGHFVIEAELDLHRMKISEAREQIAVFLVQARQEGRRCVRIVHGKGLGSKDKLPVLKGKINAWLQQKDEVLAFCSALPRDGGTGAVYVLLKR